MASINWAETTGQMAMAISEEFPDSSLDLLSKLTVEEMFYVMKLLEYRPKPYCKPDLLLRVCQEKAKSWLQGKQPKHGLPFLFLSKIWQEEFFEFVS